MSAILRDGLPGDLPDILRIYNESILQTTSTWAIDPVTLEMRRAWHADRTSRGYPVLVAEAEGRAVAFGSFGDFRPFQGYLHTVEHSVYVDVPFQRQGLGRMILTELIARAKALRKHVMVGGIDAENTASIRLHEAFGFKQCGVIRHAGRKFDRWLDLLFMQLMLDDRE